MAKPEGDEFNTAEIIAALDQYYRNPVSSSDLWRDEPVDDSHLVYPRLSESNNKRIVYMEQAVSFLVQMGMLKGKEADTIMDLPRCMECFKQITVQRLRKQNASELEIELVGSLTIQPVAAHAIDRYREISDSLATMDFGSREHRQALERAAFWSNASHRIGLAAKLSS